MKGLPQFLLVICLSCVSVAEAKVLVTVNGEKITVDDYNVFTQHHKAKTYAESGKKEQEVIISSLINRQLLVQEALKQKLNKNPNYINQIKGFTEKAENKALKKELEHNILANLLLAKLSQGPEYSFDVLKKEYEKEKKNSRHDYLLYHILTKSKRDAAKAIQRLKKGEKFSAVAKSMSIDSSARLHGKIGWVSKNIVPRSFHAALKTKPKKYYPQPVKSKFGWHVIKLEAVNNVELADFETVKNQLRQEKFNRHMLKFISKLRNQSNIKYPKR